jgi:uncharacterized protein YndB with AHSA1/START domain
MPATATETDVITRQVHIAAKPETVYALIADPARMGTWLGRKVEADAHPGGILRVDYNGFDIMRGTFLELVPHSRVVWSWGWESLGTEESRPGDSTVEFSLEPEGEGTLLKIRHSGLGAHELESHGGGWDWFMVRIKAAAAGEPVEQMGGPLNAAEEFASQLNTLLIRLLETIERCPDDAWLRPVPNDGRTVAVVANHAAGHAVLAEFSAAIAHGQRPPIADVTGEALAKGNAEDAERSANVTRAEVIARIREAGPPAVDALRNVAPADLANTQAMGFAGGAQVSAQALAEGPLLHDIGEHLAGIQAAIGR